VEDRLRHCTDARQDALGGPTGSFSDARIVDLWRSRRSIVNQLPPCTSCAPVSPQSAAFVPVKRCKAPLLVQPGEAVSIWVWCALRVLGSMHIAVEGAPFGE
jgi:hypothetical protein